MRSTCTVPEKCPAAIKHNYVIKQYRIQTYFMILIASETMASLQGPAPQVAAATPSQQFSQMMPSPGHIS